MLPFHQTGNTLLLWGPWEHRLNVFVRKVGENKAGRITGARQRDIARYAWANNRRIVYIQDNGGDENFKLYAVDIDGSNFKEITPFEEVRVGIVDRLEDIEDEMLISMNKRDKRIFDVYRINVNTGKMKNDRQLCQSQRAIKSNLAGVSCRYD